MNKLEFSTLILKIIAETDNYEIEINFCRIGNYFGHRFQWEVTSPQLAYGWYFPSLNEAVKKAFDFLYEHEDNLTLR